MKSRLFKMIALVLVFALAVCPVSVMAATGDADGSIAEPQASNYIHVYSGSISNNGGAVTVSFSIGGTGTMSSIGAQRIVIKNSSGSTVKTFHYYTTTGMMGYNTFAHGGSVTWTGGSASAKYYAVITLYAANSSGSDTATYITAYS